MLIPYLNVPVFQLSVIDQYLVGYFMDRDGAVYSTKSGKPTRISGSTTPSGRYYTLNKRTHRADDLFRKARNHPTFAVQTSSQPVQTLITAEKKTADEVLGLPGRTKSARTAVSCKGFMLATLNPQGKLVFGTDPVFHVSDTTAKQEAERIASNTGAEVVMLKFVGKVKVQQAVWE